MFASQSDILKIYYHRFENDYENWNLWIWNETDSNEGFCVYPHIVDSHHASFVIDLKNHNLIGKKIGVLPRLGSWESKDDPNRYILPNHKQAYIVENDEVVYSHKPDVSPKILYATVFKENSVSIFLSKKINLSDLEPNSFTIKINDRSLIPLSIESDTTELLTKNIILKLKDPLLTYYKDIINKNAIVFSSLFRETHISPGILSDTSAFYSDESLFPEISNNKATIKIFSPTALSGEVLLYETADSNLPKLTIPLVKNNNYIWKANVSVSTFPVFYKVKMNFKDRSFEGIDPHSICNTGHKGKGILFLPKPSKTDQPTFDISESIIYELHIRDFTIHPESGIKNKGKYLGIAEENTTHTRFPDILTGLSHLEELGVTVIQIMPFQDFDNNEFSEEYNWGYMPAHFNSPDGWFSTNPLNTSRVSEMRTMIDALHKKGFKVVLDVVYNHTAESDPNEGFGLNAMAPQYYYRKTRDGGYSNGSGCGNEFRSESPMGRKFIIDSLKFWVKEHKIDGFRFDLMGLIDLETIKQIVKELKQIKPDILIYGEPWTAGSTPIEPTLKGSQKNLNFSVFNDHFRDALKGSVWDEGPGYVSGNYNLSNNIKTGITGSINDFTHHPLETINYSSCHDNHTLYDRIHLSCNKKFSNQQMENMIKLTGSILLTSQGIPFLHSGQEFLRTKNGEHNSYNLPDSINQIYWNNKKLHPDIFRHYKNLIKMRKEHPVFRMKTREEVINNLKFLEELSVNVPQNCIAYQLNGKNVNDSWKKAIVLINPFTEAKEFNIPNGNYYEVFSHKNLYSNQNAIIKRSIKVPPISMTILSEIEE